MLKSTLYPTIYVLGNGQLGRMLRYAGAPLDIHVQPLDFNTPPFNLMDNSVITAEIERWETTPLTEILANHKNFINKNIFAKLADRLSQKSLLDTLALPTSPWCLLQEANQWDNIFHKIGEKVVVKRRIGGYDGRGQWIINHKNNSLISNELLGEVIVEKFIPFDNEISIIGARFKNGNSRFYPISHNLQQNGILRCSVANINANNQSIIAEQMLAKIMNELDYVGVMAMECFVIDNKLLINELAPRVHNSGHWTQLGCSINQFELHLRALLDLPTPKLQSFAPSVMINLIGIEHNTEWLNIPFSQLHWYGKEVRAGRKVGHINFSHPDINIVIQQLEKLQKQLPDDYQYSLNWAIEKLK